MRQRRSRLGSFPSGGAPMEGWELVPFRLRLRLGLSMKKAALLEFGQRSSGCPSKFKLVTWQEKLGIPVESANRRYRFSPMLALPVSASSPDQSKHLAWSAPVKLA
uniref:Uncharacterized protein n=1 Tax=Oryza rufipogon TaxID=4529 RepID=A0A0E0PYY9_ORYRU